MYEEEKFNDGNKNSHKKSTLKKISFNPSDDAIITCASCAFNLTFIINETCTVCHTASW